MIFDDCHIISDGNFRDSRRVGKGTFPDARDRLAAKLIINDNFP